MKRDLDFVVARPSAAAFLATPPVLACVVAVVVILACFHETARSIVSIWWRSDTFAHGFVVIPIALWFAWRKRVEISLTPAQPWWPGAILVAAFGAVWFVASAADVLGVRQFALAFMLQSAIVTIVGLRVAKVIAFPLAFALFAVPFGEFLVPVLIDWTADFTIAALKLSGVPVYREANHFHIPSGYWSVVEACSGVRYLIASVMVGTTFAAIAYRSWKRRALFLLASILVPILANWLRAYMIVMIGHLSNNRLAVGVDHIIYGWIFFGVVMVALFWVGSLAQEPSAAPMPPAAVPVAQVNRRPGGAFYAAAVAAILAAAVWLPLDARTGRGVVHPLPELPPIAGTGGWSATPALISDWRPNYRGYAIDYRQAYVKDGTTVGLHIAYYRDQVKGAELITSTNLLTPRESASWKEIADGSASIEWAGGTLAVRTAELQGKSSSLDVYYFYRVAGRETASPYVAKALLAWSRLSGRGDDAALVVLFAPAAKAPANAALRAFAQAMSPSIDQALAAGEASQR